MAQVEYWKYMEQINGEARIIWRDVFYSSRNVADEQSLDTAVKLANQAVDAYLKKCKKLATNDWITNKEI